MQITRGKIKKAVKCVLYGPEGIGKSTFASKFPDAVFIDTEGGTNALDVARLPNPSSWQMILEQIDYVKNNPATCKTLVIDTIDWAERMCVESILAKHQKESIESFGYGQGYIYIAEEFGRFLNRLQDVIEAGINVLLLAHAQIRKFEQPDEMGAYDRYELKLGKKTGSQISPLVKEWADMLLFANYKTFSVAVDDKGKKHKAQGGKRTMYASHHSCWDAKNRFSLPEEMDFSFDSIASVINGAAIKPAAEARPAEDTKKDGFIDFDKATAQSEMDLITGKVKTNEPVPESPKEERAAPPQTKDSVLVVDEKIPNALRDLMAEKAVGEDEVRKVVADKGYYPLATPIANYDEDFINGVLVGAWPKVFGMIEELRKTYEIPFDK